ncbi:bcl-2-like protein 13 [Salvelinus alpinus]|uniref:bcl-2-like protein 13 n=1 Tax=Salvelinus alpinus TaxID=8036 RepID=UPI0039FD4B78
MSPSCRCVLSPDFLSECTSLTLFQHLSLTYNFQHFTERSQWPVFSLEGKVPAVSRGDDSEVSSLSGEQKPDWLGLATLQLSQGDSGGSGPWQTESSLVESWSTMGDMMDPEDTKSLDSSDGVVHLAEERSGNHSSISDMVHLEREEEEMLAEEEEEDGSLEEEEELQASVMSVLGGEGELAELREEELDTQELLPSSEVSADQQETMDLMMSVAEELFVQEEPSEVSHATTVSMPMPVWKLEPPSASSTPVPSIPTLAELHSELQYSMQEQLHPPPVLGPGAPQPPDERQTNSQPESSVSLPAAQETQEIPPVTQEVPPEKTEAEPATSLPATELPVLMCGGAAMVAIVGVLAYGAVAYCRK